MYNSPRTCRCFDCPPCSVSSVVYSLAIPLQCALVRALVPWVYLESGRVHLPLQQRHYDSPDNEVLQRKERIVDKYIKYWFYSDSNFTPCPVVLFEFPSKTYSTIDAVIDGDIHVGEITL